MIAYGLLPRIYYGPEFLADRFARWCTDRGIALRYIQPGQPNQNAFVEGSIGPSVMKCWMPMCSNPWTKSGKLVQPGCEYNKERPHDTLDGMPPFAFLAHQNHRKLSFRSVSMTGELTVLLEHQGLNQEGEGSGDNASSELSPAQKLLG